MAKKSLKTHKTTGPSYLPFHTVFTPVIPFGHFSDVFGLYDNYLICIFININIKNYAKFGKSRKNMRYIITSVSHVNRPKMLKVVAFFML